MGGQTWPQDVFAYAGDKQWITIDRTGGIGHGIVYMVSTSNTAAQCNVGSEFTRSIDGGLTYPPSLPMPGNAIASTLAYASDGTLYFFGATFPRTTTLLPPEKFELTISVDAQDPMATPTFSDPLAIDLAGYAVFGGAVNPAGIVGQAWIAVDRSAGPHKDNVYVLSSVKPLLTSDPLDVMFARSRDR